MVGTTCLQRLEDDVKALLKQSEDGTVEVSKWTSGVLRTAFIGRAKAW